MLTVATRGPDQPNIASLPFVALKGGVESGEFTDHPPVIFLMQEATYLAHRKTDLHAIAAVGLPSIGDVVAFLEPHGFEMIVCSPCAVPRGIGEADLVSFARMGGAADLAKLVKEHHFVLTF